MIPIMVNQMISIMVNHLFLGVEDVVSFATIHQDLDLDLIISIYVRLHVGLLVNDSMMHLVSIL
jgi:hypothetical protein